MIFVTIGTTEPFDRLVMAMDNIAAKLPSVQIIAQISNTNYEIRHMERVGFLPPSEYYKLFDKAPLIISHAGMGTIISALLKQKDIIVMARRSKFNEANSDHQFGTASKLAELNYIKVVENEGQLFDLIKKHLNQQRSKVPVIGPYASGMLISSLKEFINSL